VTTTYDFGASPLGQCRLLGFDTDLENASFQDEEWTVFLNLNNQDVRLATAQGVDVLAGSEAYIQKVVKLLDMTTNGPATAKSLHDYAAELRRQAYEGDGDMIGFIDVAETVESPWTYRERMVKQWMRTAG
jgi:hypothetical protein